jgi:hypothetical protein
MEAKFSGATMADGDKDKPQICAKRISDSDTAHLYSLPGLKGVGNVKFPLPEIISPIRTTQPVRDAGAFCVAPRQQ